MYEMLRAWPPFCRWSLPPADEVRFAVLRTDRWCADWDVKGGRHVIRASINSNGHLSTLICFLAHEMLHAHQRIAKTETAGVEHNAEFRRIGALICKRYGWDVKQFV